MDEYCILKHRFNLIVTYTKCRMPSSQLTDSLNIIFSRIQQLNPLLYYLKLMLEMAFKKMLQEL